MAELIVVTGGARSGKSTLALTLAGARRAPRCFIATAEALDEEMRERIEKHRAERGATFETVEAPLELARALAGSHAFGAVVVDCATLFLSNLLHHHDAVLHDALLPGAVRQSRVHHGRLPLAAQLEAIEAASDALLVALRAHPATVIVVTNEVGMGIVPESALARRFRDLQGRLNQALVQAADEVYLCVAALAIRLKPAPVETMGVTDRSAFVGSGQDEDVP